jgi:hypothetical protein
MVVGTIDIDDMKNAVKLLANLITNADPHCRIHAAIKFGAQFPMEHIQGFTRSH